MTVGSRGIAVEAGAEGAKRSYTFDVPVVMADDSMLVDVAGTSTELHLTKPMLAAAPEASLVFTKRGLGTLYTDGENMVPGERKQLDGIWYAKACSLGPEDTPVTIRQTSGSLGFYLNGGIFDQAFSISRTMSPTYTFGAAIGSTNCLVKPFVFADSYGIVFMFYNNSVTRFQGGFNKTGSWAGTFNLESRAELYFENAPFVYDEVSLPARFCSYSVNRARLEFAAKGGYARRGFSFAGGMDVHFTADAAISNDQYNCSLNLLRSGESLHPKLHLHNTKQYFGDVTNTPSKGFERFIYDDTGAEIAGEAGAELHIRQTGADVVWHPIFTGAASLVKEGDKRLTLAIASPTCGRLEVREGTLGFAAEVGTANWTNCSEVVVSGGVLEVDRPDRFGNQVEYTLSGGKLDLAEGVRLRAKALTLPDGQGGWVRHEAGVYNATKLSEYISGNGELRLASGTVILFK